MKSPPPAVLHSSQVELGDIRLHFREGGSGTPILLLHGGFGSSQDWSPYLDELSREYRVVAPDSRGHGRSTIGEGPLTYGRMAGDAVRLLDHLGISRTHLVGFSDGGCVALHLLMDYPDRIRTATLIGTPYHLDNYPPQVYAGFRGFLDGLTGSGPEADAFGFKAAYLAVAPRPEDWPELVRRLGSTWLTQPTFTEFELRLIGRPVLVVKVDRDPFLPPEVFDRMASLIPSARIVHIPEGSHAVPFEQPERLIAEIRRFIKDVDGAL